MPRKEYTIHYIYKITCTINGKYYIGMHLTFNMEDGYMGSGKRIKRSIEKHGLENHVKEILEILPNRSSLKNREREIVNEELLNDSLCMNLTIGGNGGFSLEASKKGGKALAKRLKDDESFRKYHSNLIAERNKIHKKGKITICDWNGRKHSNKTKEKMKISHSGSNNSQFGKTWITNGQENKKILRGSEIPNGWKLGRVIKLVIRIK